MSVLLIPNFPARSQLASVPGRVVQNAKMDCVWESTATVANHYWPDLNVSGDEIIDFVKGPAYTGAGNAAWEVGDIGHHFGVDVSLFQADRARLMSALRDYMKGLIPSLVTIPGSWNTQPTLAGYNPDAPRWGTHACTLYGIDEDLRPDGEVWLMNPWPRSHAGSSLWYVDEDRMKVTVAWLQRRLCYRSIWPVKPFTTWRNLPAIPGYEDNGTQLRKKGSSVVLVKGFRKYALLHPELFSGVFADQEPLKNEYPFGNGTEQPLTYVKFVWTPASGVRLEPNQLAA